ncbi:MAG: hypothetical protein ACE5ES_03175 [Candidatus Nanoarchaeia archaeon]
MEFRFTQTSHRDTIIHYDGQQHNLSPHHILENTALFWLANLQRGRGNIFEDLDFSQPEINWDTRELEELLETATFLVQTLPLPIESFNHEMLREGFSYFNNGPNSIFYQFKLEEDSILYLRRKFRDYPKRGEETILALNASDTANLAKSYVQFVSEEEGYGRFQDEIQVLVNRLGEYR